MKKLLPRRENGGFVNLVSDFVNGAVLGACISTLSFPFNVAKVQMQKCSTFQPGMNPFKAIVLVTKERGGISGLYKGAQVNFFRALLSWGIVNMVYEKAGVLFKDDEEDLLCVCDNNDPTNYVISLCFGFAVVHESFIKDVMSETNTISVIKVRDNSGIPTNGEKTCVFIFPQLAIV